MDRSACRSFIIFALPVYAVGGIIVVCRKAKP